MRFASLILALALSTVAAADDKVVFDFEDAAGIAKWSQSPPVLKTKEPKVAIEQSSDKATDGKHSLKLTYSGGTWPTVGTDEVSQDWLKYKAFKADVTAERSCVIGFTIIQEKSRAGEGWEDVISRWTATAFLKPGKNEVVASLLQPNDYAVHPKWGKVLRFEIFLYAPHEGESIFVDRVRLSNDALPAKEKTTMTIQGTDWTVAGGSVDGCRELARTFAHLWNKPAAKTLDQVEDEFRAKHAELKKRYPKSVLAVLRDGEKGFDRNDPEKEVFAGWKDAYWSSHGPDTAYAERARNHGRNASHEIFMRHRSPLMRVDLASIPAGSNILAAQLVIVKTSDKLLDDHNPEKRPGFWVVEPCNRPWDEYEVNAFQYAKDKFWKDIGGFHRGGNDPDPDFLPIFLAYGWSRPGLINTWDFTQAVRFWTSGKNANHGFMLHGDSTDYFLAHSREAADIRNRPALYVLYDPK